MKILVLNSGSGAHESCFYDIGDLPDVRATACRTLAYVGLSPDGRRNAHPSLDEDIPAAESLIRVLVIRADWALAAEYWKLSRAAAPPAKVSL